MKKIKLSENLELSQVVMGESQIPILPKMNFWIL